MTYQKYTRELFPDKEHQMVAVGGGLFGNWQWLTSGSLPYTVINHAIPGSTVQDTVDAIDYQVFASMPRVILFAGGGEDILNGQTAEYVMKHINRFLEELREQLPDTHVLFMSVAKTTKQEKEEKLKIVDETNILIGKLCKGDERLHFLDTNIGLVSTVVNGTHRIERMTLFSNWDGETLRNNAQFMVFMKLYPKIKEVWDAAGGEERPDYDHWFHHGFVPEIHGCC